MALGYLGLGSNVGDRLRHLRDAVAALPRHGVGVRRSSSVYETQPVGLVPDQRDFLNACLRVETDHDPQQLLDASKSVERELGRQVGGPRHGPRVIDVDVLMLDGVEYRSPSLVLPHPSMLERRFVLVPLLELDPDLALPDGRKLAAALDALGPGQSVTLANPPL
jgi:2-amino-4-hydroxy-6-hydroxymethyldihydropteridine diphosphokinase